MAFVEESGEARTYALAATMGALTDDLPDRFPEIPSEYRPPDPWAASTLGSGR